MGFSRHRHWGGLPFPSPGPPELRYVFYFVTSNKATVQLPFMWFLPIPIKHPFLGAFFSFLWLLTTDFIFMGPEGPRTLAKALHDTLMLFFPRCSRRHTHLRRETYECHFPPSWDISQNSQKGGQNKLWLFGTNLRPLTCIYNLWSTFDEL